MTDIRALDRLIRINQEAYDETFKWEKSHRRTRSFNKALLIFNIALFIYNLAYLIFNFSAWSIFLAFVALGLLVFTVRLIERGKEHQEWILMAREAWEADLRHWQAVKIEIEETDEVPEWAYQIPSKERNLRPPVDKS